MDYKVPQSSPPISKSIASEVSVTSNYCGQSQKLPDHKMCAYDRTEKSCRGDKRGGSLVCSTNGGVALHGIVPAANTICVINGHDIRYSVYTDVFPFKEAIEDQINRGNDHTCPFNRIGFQDGQCNSRLNNAENCFDGGDCCNDFGKEFDVACLKECKYHGHETCYCYCRE